MNALTTDPAWFYSSLAQSSAAIVGLIGAILGSRIISHIAQLREERPSVDKLVLGVHRQISQRRRHLRDFAGWLTTHLAAANDVALRNPKAMFWTRGGMDWTGTGPNIHVQADAFRQERETTLQEVRRVLERYPQLSGGIDQTKLVAVAESLRAVAAEISPDAHPILTGDADALATLRQRLADFQRKLLPRSFLVVFAILVWLAATGVAWPLTELPGYPGSPWRSLMLLAFGVGLLGLAGFFGYQFFELTQLGRVSWPSENDLQP